MTSTALAWMLAWAMAGPSKELDAAIDRAEAHFLAEQYDRASEAFAEAYELDPDPKYLYARAQAERLHGNCAAAIDLYQRFLDTDPPDPASTEAVLNRDRCKEIVEAERPPPAAPAPTVEIEDDAVSAPPTPRDVLGFALIGTGGVALAVGAGLWGIAIANDREAPESRTEDDFIESKSKARTRHRAGIAVTSIGAALLVAGAVRLIILAKRRPRNTTATIGTDGRGAGLILMGRF
jgi:tetratricopeptide (TPR) repeat protein